jgi:hypothetical protein
MFQTRRPHAARAACRRSRTTRVSAEPRRAGPHGAGRACPGSHAAGPACRRTPCPPVLRGRVGAQPEPMSTGPMSAEPHGRPWEASPAMAAPRPRRADRNGRHALCTDRRSPSDMARAAIREGRGRPRSREGQSGRLRSQAAMAGLRTGRQAASARPSFQANSHTHVFPCRIRFIPKTGQPKPNTRAVFQNTSPLAVPTLLYCTNDKHLKVTT